MKKLDSKTQKSLIELDIRQLRDYLKAELDVLENVKLYKIIYNYINQLPERMGGLSRIEFLQKIYSQKDMGGFIFLRLQKNSKNYHWGMGSVPEDKGKMLEKLAEKFSIKKYEIQ